LHSTKPKQARKRPTFDSQFYSRRFSRQQDDSQEPEDMQTTTGQKLFCISAFLAVFFVTCARTSVEARSANRAGVSAFLTSTAPLRSGPLAHAAQKTFAIASWYGQKFQGRRTSSGERFDLRKMTAAHKTLPLGSLVKLTSPITGRSVVVRINDRGPWLKGRDFDLSEAAAARLGMHEAGVAPVEMALIK
jgi:rare lipoprotein A (peptidoglycan hydrolase)